MPEESNYQYKYLEPRPGANYRQWYVKGRKIRAEVLYRATVGEDPRTPEEVARDYELPLEMVLEAIHYATHHEDLLREERERDWAWIREQGLDKPPYAPAE
jgi:uncharacterized protein (DUF433 family)